MYSELIVMVFSGKEDVDSAWQLLKRSQGGKLFGLVDVILVHREKLDNIALHLHEKASDRLNNSGSRLTADFAEVIFGTSRAEGRRQLADAGMDPFFLQEVSQALKPGNSACLIHLSKESLIDARRLIEILEGLQGVVYHTTFQPQVEEALLKSNG